MKLTVDARITELRYLREKDKTDLRDRWKAATVLTTEAEIIAFAQHIVSTVQRNKKIDAHEQLIQQICETIMQNTNVGDALTIAHTADWLHYELHLHGNDKYASPVGATAHAFYDLVNQGLFARKSGYANGYQSDDIYIRIA